MITIIKGRMSQMSQISRVWRMLGVWPVWRFIKEDWVALLLILISVLLQLSMIVQPLEWLITNILPDDAFYYFQVARNTIKDAGLLSSFDGVSLTNGYHPLWFFILLPIFKFFSVGGTGDVEPIRVALFLQVLFNVGSAFGVNWLVKRFALRKAVRYIALGLFLFNPFMIYETLNGLETSLSILMLILFTVSVVKVLEKDTRMAYWMAGLTGGLLVLSRIESILYVAVFILYVIWKNRLGVWRDLIRFALPFVFLVVPWFVLNYQVFGTFMTSASLTSTLVNHHLVVDGSWFGVVKAVFYFTYNQILAVLNQTGIPELFLIVLGIGLVYLLKVKDVNPYHGIWQKAWQNWHEKGAHIAQVLVNIKPEVLVFCGFLLVFIANASVRWTSRSWYFIAFNIFAVLFVAFVIDRFGTEMSNKFGQHHHLKFNLFLIIFAALSIFSFGAKWSRDLKDREIAQKEMYSATEWLNENAKATPPRKRARIGVFNAGIQAYFSNHQVINLDGLISFQATDAIKNRTLWAFIKSLNIIYISDYDIYMTYRYKDFFGISQDDLFKNLELIKKIHLVEAGAKLGSEGISIYKVK